VSEAAPTVTYRLAREDDAPALAPLLGELGYPATPAELRPRLARLAADPATHVVVAVAGDTPVGIGAIHFIGILEGDRPLAALTLLIVAEAAQGRGVGAGLVGELEREAVARKSFAITVHSGRQRIGAHAFYQRLGFELTGERIRKLLTPDGGG